jgi:hypothetical protein
VTTYGQVRKFEYNSSKQLVRVSYKSGTSINYDYRDTIYYNTSGQVSKVENYLTGNSVAQSTDVFNYVAGVLTSVTESSSNYLRTRTFTYASGKLSAQTVTYTSGNNTGGIENINSIIFTGNNITSLDLVGYGPTTLTWETTTNPYYGLNFESSDFINMFCANNIKSAFLTASPTTIFVDNTYTYASGRVATIIDGGNTTYLTYVGL